MPPSVADLTQHLTPPLRDAFNTLNGVLEAGGATADVKTIYVSYTIRGEVVGALYPRAREIELALALAEDHPSDKLRDATHLTWRTLPVSVLVRDGSEASAVLPLVEEAIVRVQGGQHDVSRSNEHFTSARRQRLDELAD